MARPCYQPKYLCYGQLVEVAADGVRVYLDTVAMIAGAMGYGFWEVKLSVFPKMMIPILVIQKSNCACITTNEGLR